MFFDRFHEIHSHRHSVEDIIWLQRAHSTFTMLYYLTCYVLRNNETKLFETNICDTTEHAVMLIKERQDKKAYFVVRYEFSCLIWFCLWIWNPCKDRVRKTGLALTISRLFHWYTSHTAALTFFSRFTQTAVDGLRRLVWLWPSPDSFIDTLLSHCSAHILLSVYSDCSRWVKKTGLALTISRLFHWYTTVTLQRSHSSLGLLRLQ